MPRKPVAQLDSHQKDGEQFSYPTYKDLRKDMKSLLNKSRNNAVSVYREKRGEWGEWFENWVMSNGKPRIQKEGWM